MSWSYRESQKLDEVLDAANLALEKVSSLERQVKELRTELAAKGGKGSAEGPLEGPEVENGRRVTEMIRRGALGESIIVGGPLDDDEL